VKRPVPKQDFEALTVILSVSMVVAIVALLTTLPGMQGVGSATSGVQGYSIPAHLRNAPVTENSAYQALQQREDTVQHSPQSAFREAFQEPQTEQEARVQERFEQAVALLHAKRYDYAITALDAVLLMAPDMPEAYVNMGYAFLGLEEYAPARNAFEKAIDLRLEQTNAYYGLAIAYEGLEDYEAALGAMRSYIHLSPPDDPYLTRARAALWEWEGQLGRIQGVQPAPEGAEPVTIRPQVPGH
jgi:tetratricopeptide (TPR) repeat protein